MYPRVYSRNRLDKYTDGSATSNGSFLYRVNDNRPESYWQSSGETDEDGDRSCRIYRYFRDANGNNIGYTVDTVALLGINLKDFRVYWYNGTQWNSPSAWNFTTNTLENLFLSLSPAQTVYGIYLEIDKTIVANEEKKISEIYAGLYDFELTDVLTVRLQTNARERKKEIDLADGSKTIWRLRETRKLEFTQNVRNMTRAQRDNLESIMTGEIVVGYRPDGDEYPDWLLTGFLSGLWNEGYTYKADIYDARLRFKAI